MARKVDRALFGAVAVSLATHMLLLGQAANLWILPAQELAFPIEASLIAPAPAPEPLAVAPKRPAAAAKPPAEPLVSATPMPEPVIDREPLPPPAPDLPPSAPSTSEPVASVVAEVIRLPSPPAPPPPAAKPPGRPVVRTLPSDLVIHYSVQIGEGDTGFVAGRATYIWQSRNGRYSLVSTVEATGLAALFVSGRLVQLSEGEIDSAGLRPSQYWLQRNERKQDIARFNWDRNQLTLEGRASAVLSPQAQDLLSFPFHLVITASEGETDFVLGVTNGRKLNEYAFHVLGRERIGLKGRQLETLHLRGVREGEGSLDVWLDLDHSGLPARIRTLDRKGKVMELLLEGVGKAAEGSGG